VTVAHSGELVSIITPAYNAGRFIGETIRSVQAQTWADWELLVVDDVSRDATADIVRHEGVRDPRVRLLQQPQNGGPGPARNAGLVAARGHLVAFLDADDLWLPGKLEMQVAALARSGAGLCFTAYRRISEDLQTLGRLNRVPARLTYRQLLRNTAIFTSTVCLDRRVTGPIESRTTFHDDFVLWLEILKRGVTAIGLPDDLVRYRILDRSYSRNKRRMAYHVWRTYRDHEQLGLLESAWCFANYAWNGYWKYRRF